MASLVRFIRGDIMQIRLFITGGTIDKSYHMQSGHLHFVDSHIPAMLAEGRCKADYELDKILLKDSLEMTESDRLLIAQKCQQAEQCKIIITHGTDTMIDTARFLSEQITDKTIVLTGAMIPYVFNKSDSLFNLGTAFAAVQTLPFGVYIAMNGCIFNAHEVIKNRDDGVFESI